MNDPSEEAGHRAELRGPLVLLAVSLLAMVGIGAWYYAAERDELRSEAVEVLETVAGVKAGRLADWRRERLAVAAVLSDLPGTRADARLVLSGRGSGEVAARLMERFRSLQRHERCSDVRLVDVEGRLVLSLESGPTAISPELRRVLAETFRRREARLTDLHEGPGALPPHIEAVAPVFADAAQGGGPLGAILLRSRADQGLYGLIAGWPVPSASAETVLVRRDGDHVLFLNDLRHGSHPALRLRLPLERTDLLAVQAIRLGRRGPVEGRDYRGVEVIGATYPVPDSDWFVVSKVDLAEVRAPLVPRFVPVAGLLASLFVASALAALLLQIRERGRRYRRLYEAERGQAESERQLSATFELASIGLAQADPRTGRWLRVNQRMCAITGYTAEEMLALRVSDITHPADREADWRSFERVVRGEASEYRMEKRYLRKDGRPVWVNVNMTVVRDASGAAVRTMAAVEDISERKQAEAALRQSETRFATVFHASPQPVALARLADGVLLDVNAAWCRLTGFSREEAVGRTTLQLGVLVAPGDRERVVASASREGTLQGVEVRIRSKSGRLGELLMSAVPVDIAGERCLVSMAVDITETKRIEAERRRSEALRHVEFDVQQALAEAADAAEASPRVLASLGGGLGFEAGLLQVTHLGTGRLETAGTWADGSPEARLLAAASRGEVSFEEREAASRPANAGARWLDDLPGLAAGPSPGWADAARAGGFVSGVLLPLASEGRMLGQLGLFSRRPRPAEPELLALLDGVRASLGQFLARTRAQEELQAERNALAARVLERTAELRRLNQELQGANRMKDEFLASMSHELRTPLNAVLGISEALQESVYGRLAEKQAEALRTIEESGRHLLELINDILDVAKIEAGRVVVEAEDVALAPACEGVRRLIHRAAEHKGVALEQSVEPETLAARVDPRRLKQILVNLLSNAVKFTPAGGRAGLEVRPDGPATVRLTVWDTGIGIAPEDLPRLFQPFTQLDNRLAREHTGTGLGLALVRRLAELHGGSAEISSELGRGTRVSVRLPAGGSPPEAPDPGEG